MKKFWLILVVAGLNSATILAAQTAPAVTSRTKPVTMMGSVTADEKSFINDDDQKIWVVTNPKLLKNRFGQHISITGKLDAVNDKFSVQSVKVIPPAPPMNNDDRVRTDAPAFLYHH